MSFLTLFSLRNFTFVDDLADFKSLELLFEPLESGYNSWHAFAFGQAAFEAWLSLRAVMFDAGGGKSSPRGWRMEVGGRPYTADW